MPPPLPGNPSPTSWRKAGSTAPNTNSDHHFSACREGIWFMGSQTGEKIQVAWHSLCPDPSTRRNVQQMRLNVGGAWVSGPRRMGPDPPGRPVSPVPPLHAAAEIVPLSAMSQPSGGARSQLCLTFLLPILIQQKPHLLLESLKLHIFSSSCHCCHYFATLLFHHHLYPRSTPGNCWWSH